MSLPGMPQVRHISVPSNLFSYASFSITNTMSIMSALKKDIDGLIRRRRGWVSVPLLFLMPVRFFFSSALELIALKPWLVLSPCLLKRMSCKEKENERRKVYDELTILEAATVPVSGCSQHWSGTGLGHIRWTAFSGTA